MKKNILVFLFLFSFVNTNGLFAQVEAPEPLFVSKTATPIDDDRMKLTLESFVSGNNQASDIAILMDMSASMNENVTGSGSIYTKERATVQTSNWTYSSLGVGNTTGDAENQWYYLHNGVYYPVRRDNSLTNNNGGHNARAMWICLDPENPDIRKYLSGNGLADDYDHTITSNTKTIYRGTLYKAWTYASINETNKYFYLLDEVYYPVARAHNVKVDNRNTDQLTVTIGGTTYYLCDNGLSPDPNPNATTSDNIALYFGDLYYLRNRHRKGDFLKLAVEALLDVMSHDAKLDELDHRIALAQFNSSGWLDGRNATADLPYPYLDAAPIGGENAHLVSDFKVITNDDNVAALKDAMILPHNIGGVSHYEWGFSLARSLYNRESGSPSGTDIDNDGSIAGFEMPTLTGNEHDTYASRPKIVVIIGDCQHNGDSSADDTYINYLKDDFGAHIFVVYVNTSTGTPLKNAQAWASDEDMISKVNEFDETLISAFQKLAKDIRKALIDLGKQATVQDVVAEGYEIPTPASDKVAVYLSDYVSGKAKEDMVFDDAHRVPATDSISVNINGSTVSVSGFDYSENYCGTVGGEKHGKKLILEIEIARNTAVGGPSAITNVAESSGMKDDDGEFIANFTTSFTSTLPVTIQIQKDGLAKGESAVFTVQPIDETGNPISSVSGTAVKPHRVILTGNASGTSVTATLKHLNGDCNWLVTEEGWSWAYETNGGNTSISTATQLLNPFIFTNVKQSTTVKAAESKVTNDFSAASSTTVSSRD